MIILLLVPTFVFSQLSTESAWLAVDQQTRERIDRFSEDYKLFLQSAKTELAAVNEIKKRAEAAGFMPLSENSIWQAGRKYYEVNRDRAICLMVAGQTPLEKGLHVIAGHIDSPRIELKARPLYEKEEFALFQTVYHGGLKKYQWTNIPLALIGRIDKTDGSTIWIDIGNKSTDPVFLIPDLAPHVDRPYRNRSQQQVIKGEELDPIAGSIPNSNSIEDQILQHLKSAYGISKSDFISAELALVPALQPRDIGFDEGLVAGYGQDDKSSCFPALIASIEMSNPQYTTISYFADNEESGSNNNTGAKSGYFPTLITKLLQIQNNDEISQSGVNAVLENAYVVSADATTGIHPQFTDVQEKHNAGRLSHGVVIKRYGRGSDARSEIIANFRAILEKEGIPYQTHTYKVDVGGGGTLGGFLAIMNMDVIDVGVPLLSMHSPYEISSKIDVWYLYQAFRAFYR